MTKRKRKPDQIKILHYFHQVKIWFIILSFLMIGYTIINIFNPIIGANLLTSLTEFNMRNMGIFTFLFLIISFVKIVINRLMGIVLLKKINSRVIYNIRSDMISNIFRMKTINFDKYTSGELSERLKSDPETIMDILGVVQYSLFSMITEVIILLYVFWMNYILGLIYLACVFVVYFYEKRAFLKYEEFQTYANRIKDKSATLLNESMRGIRDIKVLNIKDSIYSKINQNLIDSTDCNVSLNLQYEKITSVIEIIKMLTTVMVILVGLYLISLGQLTTTSLIVIYMYRTDIYDLVLCYTSIKEYYTKYSISASRIFEIMDPKSFPKMNLEVKV